MRELFRYTTTDDIYNNICRCQEKDIHMPLEKTTQNNVIQVFKKLGYEYIGSNIKLKGHSPKLDDLFRREMNRLNREVLAGNELSDDEFLRLKNEIPKNSIEAFSVLRNGASIVLDDNKKVTIKFIDKNNNENNTFQITDELTIVGGKTNRLDLVVLINGVPISNIEMKKTGGESHSVEKAIAQINRYTDNGIYNEDLLNFVQFFVASNGVKTAYFSVDPRVGRGQATYGEFSFTWMDYKNKPVNKISDFIDQFFTPDHLLRVIVHYMNVKPLPVPQIMIMRPYQIHAIDAVLGTVDKGLGFDTYVSASTGSGKTFTTFKLGELLVYSRDKKVLVLLDRNDLAEHTTREFKSFDTNGLIKDLVKGQALKKAIENPNERLVITTIQSFNKYIENKANEKDVEKVADRRDMVIIVDECHRSTSADMFANVKRAFLDKNRNNTLKCHLIGFTGTPLLEENSKTKEQMTQVIFGEVAHIYTITEAVRDKSVNPFKLFFINSNRDKKEELDQEYYNNPLRIEANAREIVKQFKNHTLQLDDEKTDSTRGFVAMTAAGNKSSAYLYWNLFRELFALENRKTAIVFSLEQNSVWKDFERTEESVYEEILKAYDKDFGTNFLSVFVNDVQKGRLAHLSDVIKRSKKGEIDMIVVSDMLLTGYDNKLLNTIYLDKFLRDHGLLQAASRTNRLSGEEKKFGNVVLFEDRDMEGEFKKCIKLFGSAENIDEIIDSTTFKEAEKNLRTHVYEFKNLVPNPNHINEIRTEDELKNVVKFYRKASGSFASIRIYPEWDESTGYEKVGTSKDEMDEYYANIELMKSFLLVDDPKDDSKGSSLDPDFAVSTVDGYVVGYKYMLKLLNDFVASPPEERDRWLRRCKELLRNTTDSEILQNKSAIERVLVAVMNGEIQTTDDLFERLDEEIKAERDFVFKCFANDMGIPEFVVDQMVIYKLQQDKTIDSLTLKEMLKNNAVGNDLSPKEMRAFIKKVREDFDELFV